MAWFDETCISSDNKDTNDCGRIINCAVPQHCTHIDRGVIDMFSGRNLNHLKMNNKTSALLPSGIIHFQVWPHIHSVSSVFKSLFTLKMDQMTKWDIKR